MARAIDRLRNPDAPRILVVRNDGLGDFVLTLPLIASLKRQVPGCRVTVLASPVTAELVPLLPDIDEVLVDPGVLLKRHRGTRTRAERAEGRRHLLAAVREAGFDLALLPYAESGSAALVQRARIPLRAGPLRRPFFWRFNVFFRHTRRGSARAEYALNLGYLPALGLREEYAPPVLALPDRARAALPDPAAPYLVLHPYKRSGTALAWPMARFQELARAMLADGLGLVVIGDPPDRPVLEQAFGDLPGARIETGRTLAELLALLAGAALFVGNSSGPLHLAALAGTPHVGLYPQDRVSAPERWHTLPVPGAPADFRRYLLATRHPKACVTCEGERCAYFNCVADIPLTAVREAAAAWDASAAP